MCHGRVQQAWNIKSWYVVCKYSGKIYTLVIPKSEDNIIIKSRRIGHSRAQKLLATRGISPWKTSTLFLCYLNLGTELCLKVKNVIFLSSLLEVQLICKLYIGSCSFTVKKHFFQSLGYIQLPLQQTFTLSVMNSCPRAAKLTQAWHSVERVSSIPSSMTATITHHWKTFAKTLFFF